MQLVVPTPALGISVDMFLHGAAALEGLCGCLYAVESAHLGPLPVLPVLCSLYAADMSDETDYDDLSSSSGQYSASMEPVNTTAAASSSGQHSTAAAGAGGGNGVFGGLFGFNVPGANGKVQHKVGMDDTTGAGRAASAVVAAAAAMAAAADARLPRGSNGSSSSGGYGS